MPAELLQTTRPIISESDNPEWPYSGTGSCFFTSMDKEVFLVSAKHVNQKFGHKPYSLRIFPSDQSRISIPFNTDIGILLDGTEDESYKDLYLLKVDTEVFNVSSDAPLSTINLDKGCARLESISEGDKMLIFGFPSEMRGFDNENCNISYVRKILKGAFCGNSTMANCFELRLKDSGGLTDLNGFSGSPVFHLESNGIPRLAGVMITGTVSSSICHFIGVHVLVAAIKKAISQ